jgi:hypothetical protein
MTNMADALDNSQLLMRVEGTAGTGIHKLLIKSKQNHLINAICSFLNDEEYRVVAPTGKAANNILGQTYHSLLRINDRTSGNLQLKGASLSNLQELLKGIKYLILDEYSMVGFESLADY